MSLDPSSTSIVWARQNAVSSMGESTGGSVDVGGAIGVVVGVVVGVAVTAASGSVVGAGGSTGVSTVVTETSVGVAGDASEPVQAPANTATATAITPSRPLVEIMRVEVIRTSQRDVRPGRRRAGLPTSRPG